MLNENLNNMHWKDKLEDAENLPEEIVQNKNAVWKKLNSRLRQKPRRQRVTGFWAVAASLFLAILIPLFYEHRNASNLVIYTKKKDAATKSSLKKMEPVKSVAVVTPALAKKQDKQNILIERKVANTTVITTRKDEAINNDNELVKDENTSSLPVTDTAFTTAIASTIPKKKLSVIHINELGEVAEKSPEMARTTEQHIFQLKLAKEEIFTNISIAASNTSLPFFKQKTSPSN